MPNFEREINERVEAFVNDITELAKQAAQETLEVALGSARGRGGGVSKAVSSARPRRKSGKRTPEEIQETANELLEHIKNNPGQRMEAIAKALGTTTKELTLPTKKLLQGNHIRVEGQKRATSYFPSSGKPARGGRRGKRRGRRRAS